MVQNIIPDEQLHLELHKRKRKMNKQVCYRVTPIHHTIKKIALKEKLLVEFSAFFATFKFKIKDTLTAFQHRILNNFRKKAISSEK